MESEPADMQTKWAERASGVKRLLSGSQKWSKEDRDTFLRVSKAGADGRACEHPISKEWALFSKLCWNSNTCGRGWDIWSRVLCLRSLSVSDWIRHAIIPNEDRLRYQLLLAQCNCLLFRRCVDMANSDLKCAQCNAALCPANATTDDFIAALNRNCAVDHHPPSTIVHRAVKHAMLLNKTINPRALLKLLCVDARLICNDPGCGLAKGTHQDKEQQALDIVDSITL
jgi:hypothetical protein